MTEEVKMPELMELLDEIVLENLNKVKQAAQAEVALPPLEACACPQGEGKFLNLPDTTLVVHSCGKPKPRALAMYRAQYEALRPFTLLDTPLPNPQPRPQDTLTVVKASDVPATTEINGIAVDVRGEALLDLTCADCERPIKVNTSTRGISPEDLDKPRIAVCAPCGKARTQGKQGVVIRKPAVARHQPRITDGLDHPVEVKHKEKETPMPDLDLSAYGPAQLADLIWKAQERLRAQAEAALPAKVAEAIRVEEARVEADQEIKVDQREAHKGWVLDGFTLRGVEVPALNLSDVTDLNEEVTPTLRSPYNKALYRLGEPLLTSKVEPGSERKPTTWAVLVETHERLAALVGSEVKVAEQPVAPAPQVVTVIDPKVQALMTNLGWDEAKALAFVAGQ